MNTVILRQLTASEFSRIDNPLAKGARRLIRREMLYKHGIALSRMKLGRGY